MLRSSAPAALPMLTKSPSLVRAAQPPNTGTLRKFLRMVTSWVKPPVANTTALRALRRTVLPAAVSASTPITAPLPSTMVRCARWPVRMSMPSARALPPIVRIATSPPSDIVGSASLGSSTRPFGALSSGISAQ